MAPLMRNLLALCGVAGEPLDSWRRESQRLLQLLAVRITPQDIGRFASYGSGHDAGITPRVRRWVEALLATCEIGDAAALDSDVVESAHLYIASQPTEKGAQGALECLVGVIELYRETAVTDDAHRAMAVIMLMCGAMAIDGAIASATLRVLAALIAVEAHAASLEPPARGTTVEDPSTWAFHAIAIAVLSAHCANRSIIVAGQFFDEEMRRLAEEGAPNLETSLADADRALRLLRSCVPMATGLQTFSGSLNTLLSRLGCDRR